MVGEKKMELMLYSTLVEVEVGVELGNISVLHCVRVLTIHNPHQHISKFHSSNFLIVVKSD